MKIIFHLSRLRVLVFLLSFMIIWACLDGAPLCEKERDIYQSLDIMCDVISIIQRDYIEKMSAEKLMNGALRGMLRSLDGYSYYLPPPSDKDKTGGEVEVLGTYGLEVAYKEKVLRVIAPVEGGPAWKAGLKPNDMIIKIDEEPVGKNSLAELIQRFHGGKDEQIRLNVVRRGARDFLDFTLKPGKIEGPQARVEVKEDGIGLLRISRFDDGTSGKVSESLKKLCSEGAEDLVVDLRDCAGGEIEAALATAELFLPRGALITSLKGRAEGVSREFKTTGKPVRCGEGPIVILVNGGTSGAAEVLAGALRHSSDGVLMGQNSFGSAYHEDTFKLDNGSSITMLTGLYLTPAGEVIQGEGLKVDIPVEVPPLEEEKETDGKDEESEKPVKKEEKGEEEMDPVVQSAVDLIKGIRIIKPAERG